jgi:hypothetical protein
MNAILSQLRALGWHATADLLVSVDLQHAAEFARTLARVGDPTTFPEVRSALRRFAVLAEAKRAREAAQEAA